MISFELESAGLAQEVLSRTKVFLFAESLGGPESLVTYPIAQTHADMDAAVLARIGLSDRMLRLSVGLEAADDLIRDLAQALG
jgi:cystathionine beta-lyase/cystathionine gamma-synthase